MVLAQMGKDRQTVHARQQDIHQHHVERLVTRHLQALLAILAPGDLKATAAQVLMHIGAQYRVVFNCQDTG